MRSTAHITTLYLSVVYLKTLNNAPIDAIFLKIEANAPHNQDETPEMTRDISNNTKKIDLAQTQNVDVSDHFEQLLFLMSSEAPPS